MRTRRDLESEAKKNQLAHRAAEVAALAVLLRARNSALGDELPVHAASDALQRSLRSGVVAVRQGARQRGVTRLLAEADSADVALVVPDHAWQVGLAEDWERGTVLGRSYANRWLRKTTELDGDQSAAALATRGSLDRIAISESSEAFSAARANVVGDAEVATELLRIWDATLDRRTCSTCADADGTIVGITEAFAAGEPGSVHAFCRCGWQLLTVSEARGALNIRNLRP